MRRTRQLEFATGRALARRLLAGFGVEGHPLLPGNDRAPVWPSGFVGSISHSAGLCVAAVGAQERARGIGVDVERVRRLGDSILCRVCSATEIARAGEWSQIPWTILLFSAKESAYKALNASTGRRLWLRDIEVTLDPSRRAFDVFWNDPTASGSGIFRGRFDMYERYVVTGATVLST